MLTNKKTSEETAAAQNTLQFNTEVGPTEETEETSPTSHPETTNKSPEERTTDLSFSDTEDTKSSSSDKPTNSSSHPKEETSDRRPKQDLSDRHSNEELSDPKDSSSDLITTTPINATSDKQAKQQKGSKRARKRVSRYSMISGLFICVLTHISVRYVTSQLSKFGWEEHPKWQPRDILLPTLPTCTVINNGDLNVLEKMVKQNYVTVVVFYAPWSRPSHRVLENISHLTSIMVDVKFIAINCWLFNSSCRDSFNSWEYPQVYIYHEELNYQPYVYGLSTWPSSFEIQLKRFLDPVILVRKISDLTEILMSHQRSVLGIFRSYTTMEYKEFVKAAVVHHFEYVDTYFVPFIVLHKDLTTILNTERFSYLILKHVMFQPLTLFERQNRPLRHSHILNWLRYHDSPIHYLSYSKFPGVLQHNTSVLFNSPLSQNSENLVHFTRSVLSYASCPQPTPKLKVHCEPNNTCLNPCVPDKVLTQDSILPCFTSVHSLQFIQQCFFSQTPEFTQHHTTPPILNLFNSPPSNQLHTRDVMFPKTFLESDQMCTTSKTLKDLELCTRFNKIEYFQNYLDVLIDRNAEQFVAPFHGFGCEDGDNVGFYALDVASWYDMVDKFGLENTTRGSESIVKIEPATKSVHSFDLTNRSFEQELDFAELMWGNDSELSLLQRSGTNKKQKSTFVQDVNKDKLSQLLKDQSNNMIVFEYTQWCGYCNLMWKNLESVARLSSPDNNLIFVSVDRDKNDVNGIFGNSNTIPNIFLSTIDDNLINAYHFVRTIEDIIKFIKSVLPEMTFSLEYGAGFPKPEPRPCLTWEPTPVPETLPKQDLNLGLSDSSNLEILDTIPVSEISTIFTENFSDKPGTQIYKNTLSRAACLSTTFMLKTFAKSPYLTTSKHYNLLSSLLRDVYQYRCELDISTYWNDLAYQCFGAQKSGACQMMHYSSIIVNYYDNVPQTVLVQLLGLYTNTIPDHPPISTPVLNTVDIFQILHCYNFKEELLYYLNLQCSQFCTAPCRIVHKLAD